MKVEITHMQLMDAIRIHGINIHPSSEHIKWPFKGCVTRWSIPLHGIVAVDYIPCEYSNTPYIVEKYTRTDCTEAFFDRYIKNGSKQSLKQL